MRIPSMRPLVVGYPRSGFTLLITVIAHLTGVRQDRRTRSLRVLCDTAGSQISQRIEAVFARHGKLPGLIYNANFRQLVGGPKWLAEPDFCLAKFRKYIGLCGEGDFTLITSHPREVLDYYEIIHSHEAASWPSHDLTPRNLRFASMRHPVGTLTSACFSINALASEYIQRFVPAECDNDLLRQRLALYKLSDLNFFEALLSPFIGYLEKFAAVEEEFTMMRWEDLLTHPTETILCLARSLGTEITHKEAELVWAKIDHVNLTGAHKHNLRQGHGIVSGWRKWITNTHLDILRDHGLERFALRYGYGPFSNIDESDYTPFQIRLSDLIHRGEVFHDYGDGDLFGFAFNKSNIDFSRFGFRHYPWRTHTCIERSSCRNEVLIQDVSDAAETACNQFNDALRLWLDAANAGTLDDALTERLAPTVASLYDDEHGLGSFRSAMAHALGDSDDSETTPHLPPNEEPILLESRGTTNIVHFRGRYYAVPQSLGPVDFFQKNLSEIAFSGIADSLPELFVVLEKA